MALYKALTADFMSPEGYGAPFGPWVKNEWQEIEGPVLFDPNGVTGTVPNGFRCSDDIVHCQYPVKVEYIAQVEVDGDSVIYGKDQWWQKMRVVSIKAWPPSKSILTIDWAEGQCHYRWEAVFPGEAAAYEMKNYQGQWAAMLGIISPLWKSLFTHGEEVYGLHRDGNRCLLKPEYPESLERAVRLAYFLALCHTGTLTPYGAAPLVRDAAHNRPDIWEIVRGNVEDNWATLEEAV